MRWLENIHPGQSKSTKLPERKHSLRHKVVCAQTNRA
jgi:hypothetical protein